MSIIQKGGLVHIVTVTDPDAVVRLCGYTPMYLRLGEDVRIVRMAGAYGRPCLGTYVTNLCEIGPVKVRKVKQAKGRLTVSYHVATPGGKKQFQSTPGLPLGSHLATIEPLLPVLGTGFYDGALDENLAATEP
jgi:hypothetical protein